MYLACPPDEVISVVKHHDNPQLARTMRVATIENYDDGPSAVKAAVQGGTTAGLEYDTIVFDSATHYRALCVDKAIDDARGKISENMWTASNRYFLDTFRPLMRDFRHNVVIIGHHRMLKNDDGSFKGIYPDFGESLLRQLVPDLHALFYYRRVGQNRILYTASGSGIAGVELKNRYALPTEFKNPTMAEIWDAVDEYRLRAKELAERD